MRDPRDCFQKCLVLSRSLSNDRQTDRNKQTNAKRPPPEKTTRERSTREREREREREVKLCARKRFSLLSFRRVNI
jgi:hypothetical protein